MSIFKEHLVDRFNEYKEALTKYLKKEEAEKILDRLFEEIKHGDEEHQKWLKNKIEDFKKTL